MITNKQLQYDYHEQLQYGVTKRRQQGKGNV